MTEGYFTLRSSSVGNAFIPPLQNSYVSLLYAVEYIQFNLQIRRRMTSSLLFFLDESN